MVPLTFRQRGTTVQAASCALLIAERGGPALVAVAVLVVVAHLEWEDSEIQVEATKKPASENKLSLAELNTTGETPLGAECLETLFFRE